MECKLKMMKCYKKETNLWQPRLSLNTNWLTADANVLHESIQYSSIISLTFDIVFFIFFLLYSSVVTLCHEAGDGSSMEQLIHLKFLV